MDQGYFVLKMDLRYFVSWMDLLVQGHKDVFK